jgi:hypothetical protein
MTGSFSFRVHLLAMLLVVPTCFVAQTPITLSNSHMPGNGDTLRFTEVQVNSVGNYTATGTNFSWDFSSATRLTEGVRAFKNALQTPYAFFFLALNEYGEKAADSLGAGPLKITDIYNYYRKPTQPVSAFLADGVGLTINGIKVPCYYTDKDELYLFPLTYPKYDSTKFRFQTTASMALPVMYSKSGYRVTKVDGWGTVTTPFGTEPCIRVVTTQYGHDSIKNTLVPIPFGFPNFVRSYQWMTLNSKIPYFEITGPVTGGIFTPASARYRGFEIAKVIDTDVSDIDNESISVFPNPVKDVLYLPADVNAGEVTNLAGQSLMRFSGRSVDVSMLPPGVYHIRTADGQHSRFVRFN